MRKKIDNKYHLSRFLLEPGYIVRRSREIIKDEERVLGESKGKDLVMRISYGYDAVKILAVGVLFYKLAQEIF